MGRRHVLLALLLLLLSLVLFDSSDASFVWEHRKLANSDAKDGEIAKKENSDPNLVGGTKKNKEESPSPSNDNKNDNAKQGNGTAPAPAPAPLPKVKDSNGSQEEPNKKASTSVAEDDGKGNVKDGGKENNGKDGVNENNGKDGGGKDNGKDGGEKDNGKDGGNENNGKDGGNEENGIDSGKENKGGEKGDGKDGGEKGDGKDGGEKDNGKDGGEKDNGKDGGEKDNGKDGGEKDTGKDSSEEGNGKDGGKKGNGNENKENEGKSNSQSTTDESCGDLKKCEDNGGMVGCISKLDPAYVVVLLHNGGADSIKVKLSEGNLEEIEVGTQQTKKVNISLITSERTQLIFNAGRGDCALPMGTPLPKGGDFFVRLPSYDKILTPVNGAYFLILTVLIFGGTWACCKFRKKRHDVVPYQEIEMAMPETAALAPNVESAEGWDQVWDDDWDDDVAVKSPAAIAGSISANGLTSRSSNKDGWENNWDD